MGSTETDECKVKLRHNEVGLKMSEFITNEQLDELIIYFGGAPLTIDDSKSNYGTIRPEECSRMKTALGYIRAGSCLEKLKHLVPTTNSEPSEEPDAAKLAVRREHNLVCLEMKRVVEPKQLRDLKQYFNGVPLTADDMGNIKTFPELWTALNRCGKINQGDYSKLETALKTLKAMSCLDTLKNAILDNAGLTFSEKERADEKRKCSLTSKWKISSEEESLGGSEITTHLARELRHRQSMATVYQ